MAYRIFATFAAILVLMTGCKSAGYRAHRYYRAASPASPIAPPARSVTSTSSVPQMTAAMKRQTTHSGSVTSRMQQAITVTNASVTSSAAGAPGAVIKPTNGVPGVYRLKVGDPVVVYLRGIPGAPGGEQQIENIVGEDGCIQLPYINDVNVLNMTATEAQEIIRKAYLDQRIYKQIAVNVVIPSRSYYIRGEIRQPGRYPLVGTVTVLQAIAAAGGYTEFASRSVEIYRGDKRIELNMRQIEKRPELDRVIEPGDIIVVDRSIF